MEMQVIQLLDILRISSRLVPRIGNFGNNPQQGGFNNSAPQQGFAQQQGGNGYSNNAGFGGGAQQAPAQPAQQQAPAADPWTSQSGGNYDWGTGADDEPPF